MHKRGYCRHAVSVCLSVCPSVTFVSCAKTNYDMFEFFLPSGSQSILVFPYQTGWRYFDRNLPNGGVECRWGIVRNRDSGLITGYRRLLDVRSVKKHLPTTKPSIWHSRPRTTGYRSIAGRANYEVTKTVRPYRRPCSVDRTVGDAPANVCLWRPAAWTNTPKRREQKEFNCTQWYIWSRNK